MIIKKLHLRHFRNYDELTLDFNDKINIFVGNNAQGKTNILEGIYVLAITKSHRTYIDANLIKKDCKGSKIEGLIKKKHQTTNTELEIVLNNKGKKVSINKKAIRKISDYMSCFNVIIFHPDDLEILKGAPSERRRFLNIEIGQFDNKYFATLNAYNNILKNRNEYLKHITLENYDKNYFDILTEQLVNKAIIIYHYRKNFIDNINQKINIVNEKIKGLDNLEIKYETSIVLEAPEIMKKNLLQKYESTLQREIIMSQTMIGPHRDDFIFFANNKNVKDFGSQGQQRMCVLYLKLAEIELFKEKKDEYPVLLLDDIFSELDKTKRRNIIKYLNKRMQIMITTTNINDVDKNLIKNASIFKVDNAIVTKK